MGEKRQRSCIGCGRQADKAELVRIVRSPQGDVFLDETGRAPGRGAYVCSQACFAAATKKGRLERALKTSIPPQMQDRIARGLSRPAGEAQTEA